MYSFRLYFIVFHGKPAETPHADDEHAHHGEGSRWMTIPVGVLAFGATFAGCCRSRASGTRSRRGSSPSSSHS